MKFHEISTLGAKCHLNVIRSASNVKMLLLCKVVPVRAQNVFFDDFCGVPIEDLNMFRCAPNVKIQLFCKGLPGRAQNTIFRSVL